MSIEPMRLPGGARPLVEIPSNKVGRRFQKIVAEGEMRVILTEMRTAARMADVHAEGAVAAVKLDEIMGLVGLAMDRYTLLVRKSHALAGDDIMLADELRGFSKLAYVAAGEIIVDQASTYRRM
jgi:hypothetical protein